MTERDWILDLWDPDRWEVVIEPLRRRKPATNLLEMVIEKYSLSPDKAGYLITSGFVLVNNAPVTNPAYEPKKDEVVSVIDGKIP